MSTPLLEVLTERERAAERAQQKAVTDARAAYWPVIDRIVAGDESGIDQDSFDAARKTLGLSLDEVDADVASIKRIREVEAKDDAVRQELAVATPARAEAEQVQRVAQAALDAAVRVSREARRREQNLQAFLEPRDAATGHPTRQQVARDAARKDEVALRERGYDGRLLSPEVPKPLRMARYIGREPQFLLGATRQPGDVFAVPPTAVIEPAPRPMKPGEAPPTRHSYLVPADAPWPVPVRTRYFRADGQFADDELLRTRRHLGHGVVALNVADDHALSWAVTEVSEPPPEAVEPVAAPVETETGAELLRENGAPVEDRLRAQLDELDNEIEESQQAEEQWHDDEEDQQ